MKYLLTLGLIAASFTSMAHEDHGHLINPKALQEAPFVDADYVTGQGKFTYKVDLNWGLTLKGQATLGSTHGGVAIDKTGNVYVSTQTKNGIIKLNSKGQAIKAFGHLTHASHNLVLKEENGQEFIYAAFLQKKGKVCKLDLEGNIIWTIEGPPAHKAYQGEKVRYKPTAVDVAPDGRIFVADGYASNLINVYSADRKYIKSFGGGGNGKGKFRTSHGLTIDTRGEKPLIIVVDRENRKLQRMTLEGEYVDTPTTGLRRPCALSIMGDYIAVAELSGRCVILDKDFKVISVLGDNPDKKQHHSYGVKPKDWKPAIFTAPHGCVLDKDLNLYVQDWNSTGRLRKFIIQK